MTIFHFVNAQSTVAFADSIRKHYNIPELGYAVISSSKIFELQTIGVKKINSSFIAEPNDKFRIGSNTKAITGFIAAELVKQGKINWDTRFFNVLPELKAKSKNIYYNVTLLNLLTFRTRLFPFTNTNNTPSKEQFSGNEQRNNGTSLQNGSFGKNLLRGETALTSQI